MRKTELDKKQPMKIKTLVRFIKKRKFNNTVSQTNKQSNYYCFTACFFTILYTSTQSHCMHLANKFLFLCQNIYCILFRS